METTNPPIHVEVRRPWDGSEQLFIVGPGAAGKSTLGRSLAARLGWVLIDLDEVFLARIGDIGAFIRQRGYEAYKRANSELAQALVAEAVTRTVFVTSSGFLTSDNPLEVLAANRALLSAGYSLSLSPARGLQAAVDILVARQMSRAFNAGPAREEATARARFDTYIAAGDLLVCSTADPDVVAAELMPRLGQ